MSRSAYGSNHALLWYHGLRDRLRGEHARANARWGYLRPPAVRGKLVWIKAGGTRGSVRTAVELLRAIRERRLDIRLVLTFERDYPDLLEERVRGLAKVGLGYGPSDAPAAVRRALQRLDPFAIIWVDHAPGPRLLAAARQRGLHTVAYGTPPVQQGQVEAAYPLDPADAQAWQDSRAADYVAPTADPLAQLVEAQVEPTFGSLVRGGADCSLAWMHLGSAGELPAVRRAWAAWAGRPDAILFVSAAAGLEGVGEEPGELRISAWRRLPVAPGSLVLVDEARWAPALAVSADAIHLTTPDRLAMWQALAGGVPVSVGTSEALPAPPPAGAVVEPDPGRFFTLWSGYREDPMGARRRGDEARRRFWEERRRSAEVVGEFLQRVYDW